MLRALRPALPASALLIACSIAAPASAATVQLDADPAMERLVVKKAAFPGGGPGGRRPFVQDVCDGKLRTIALAPAADRVTLLRAVDVDGDPSRPEIIAEVRSGIALKSGAYRIVRLDDGRCGRLQTVFSYSTGDAVRRPAPDGTRTVYTGQGWGISLRNPKDAYVGLRLLLSDALHGPSDGGCCPTYFRSQQWAVSVRTRRFTLLSERITEARPE